MMQEQGFCVIGSIIDILLILEFHDEIVIIESLFELCEDEVSDNSPEKQVLLLLSSINFRVTILL